MSRVLNFLRHKPKGGRWTRHLPRGRRARWTRHLPKGGRVVTGTLTVAATASQYQDLFTRG